MVWITLAAPNTALRSFGRRAAATPNGRLTARPISERRHADQHMAAEVIGQPRKRIGDAGIGHRAMMTCAPHRRNAAASPACQRGASR